MNDPGTRHEGMMPLFKSALETAMARPALQPVQPQPGLLFPPDAPPSLLFYFGEPDAANIRDVRGQLPAEALLCWISPPDSSGFVRQNLMPPDASFGRTVCLTASQDRTTALLIAEAIAQADRQRVHLIFDPAAKAHFPDLVAPIQHAVASAMENAGMEAGRGLVFLRSCLLNLPLMATRSIPTLPACLPGTCALVCAAGPSLREQLDLIRRMADRVLLIAVGHAVPTLLHAGIRPDIAVEDDAVAGVNWPDGLDVGEILLVAAATVDSRVARRFRRILWCEGSSPPFNQLIREGGFPLARMTLLKTVSTHALEVAVRAGCDRIGMVGQDFCLGPSGMLHADGKRAVNAAERLLEVPANEGGMVVTTKDLAQLRASVEQYLDVLDAAFRAAPRRPVIINCTHGGALVHGARRESLEAFERSLPAAAVQWSCPGPVEQPAVGHTIERARETIGIWLERTALHPPEHPGEPWFTAIERCAKRLLRETPAFSISPATPDEERLRTCRLLTISRELAADIAADLADSSATERRPEEFPSFVRLALRDLAPMNPELASWLEQHHHAPVPARFRFRWKNQVIPVMELQPEEGGEFISVAGEWTMLEEAREDVRRFLETLPASPTGVVIIAPCNWVHVLEMIARRPDLRLLVVEPWPESLGAQILHGCFLHRLPPGSLVATTDPRIPNQDDRIRNWLRILRCEGESQALFMPPRVASLPELTAIKTSLLAAP